jgi:transposase
MHAAQVKTTALALVARGVSDSEIARRLEVPRSTIRDWRRAPTVSRLELCPRCWRRTRPVRLDAGDYAELLGLYLGDGHISPFARTERLRVHLDARHSVVVDEAERLLRRAFPANRVGRASRHSGAMAILCVYHGHLSCLFPQSGPGKKHERPILLEPWQTALVDAAPWRFLRGCIRSDGCVFVNRTGPYEYVSYEFSNRSADILDLFVGTCERVGLQPRRYRRYVRLYRRDDVAVLLREVGTKS